MSRPGPPGVPADHGQAEGLDRALAPTPAPEQPSAAGGGPGEPLARRGRGDPARTGGRSPAATRRAGRDLLGRPLAAPASLPGGGLRLRRALAEGARARSGRCRPRARSGSETSSRRRPRRDKTRTIAWCSVTGIRWTPTSSGWRGRSSCPCWSTDGHECPDARSDPTAGHSGGAPGRLPPHRGQRRDGEDPHPGGSLPPAGAGGRPDGGPDPGRHLHGGRHGGAARPDPHPAGGGARGVPSRGAGRSQG